MSDRIEAVATRRRVGVPGSELVLVRMATAFGRLVLPPGKGRSTIALSEVELGFGRPDVLLAAVSRRRLKSHLRSELRLASFLEARALASVIERRQMTGITRHHALALQRRLAAKGWIAEVERGRPSLVADALLVEAKVADWRTGLIQLVRIRRLFPRCALLVPRTVAARVPRRILDRHAIGLLALNWDSVSWVRRGRRRATNLAARLWLDELVLRHADRDVNGPSAEANSSTALPMLSTNRTYDGAETSSPSAPS